MPGSSDPYFLSIYYISSNDLKYLKYTAQLSCFVFFPRPCLLSVMWRWTGCKGQQSGGKAHTCSSSVALLIIRAVAQSASSGLYHGGQSHSRADRCLPGFPQYWIADKSTFMSKQFLITKGRLYQV